MAHAVVVNCEFVRRHLEIDEGVPSQRIRLCYNGVDLEEFRPIANSREGVTIGVVCALRPEKDLGTLIEAFARLKRSGLKLSIVGSGSMLRTTAFPGPGAGARARLYLRSGDGECGRVPACDRYFCAAVALGGLIEFAARSDGLRLLSGGIPGRRKFRIDSPRPEWNALRGWQRRPTVSCSGITHRTSGAAPAAGREARAASRSVSRSALRRAGWKPSTRN